MQASTASFQGLAWQQSRHHLVAEDLQVMHLLNNHLMQVSEELKHA